MIMDKHICTKRAGILGILGNIFLLFIKAFVGFACKSQAMIADSINSASDIFASLMTFVGNKIASEPGDESHNFGHGKAEYLFSLFISISMIIASIKLLIDAATSLIYGNSVIFSYWLIVICIITIITKFILFIYTRNLYKKYHTILLKANYTDHRNDCFVTSFTLISILFSLYGIYWIDGVVGIGISLWICMTGIRIFMESYNVLMDISIDENTKNLILELAQNYEDILKVDKLYSTPIGDKYIIVLTIYVDGNLSTFISHKLADNLEKDICKLDKISSAIIHVNPI
jgi:cation diffusion facilitator family transporter